MLSKSGTGRQGFQKAAVDGPKEDPRDLGRRVRGKGTTWG